MKMISDEHSVQNFQREFWEHVVGTTPNILLQVVDFFESILKIVQLAVCVDGNGASNQEIHFRKDQKEKLRGMRPLGNDGSETLGLRRPFPKAPSCLVVTLGDAVYSLEEPGSTRPATRRPLADCCNTPAKPARTCMQSCHAACDRQRGQADPLDTQSQDEVGLCPAATFLPGLAAWSTHASTRR